MDHGVQLKSAKRRRRRLRLFVLFAFLTIIAGAAPYLEPLWRPLIAASEEERIAAEREERLLRVAIGLNLPAQPDLARLPQRLAEHGLAQGAPVLMRIFKSEFELELWMKRDGRFHRFATYPICTWSGALGPKLAEGDRQSPEGFYTVAPDALNPNSKWYRSFNLGYPNAFDRAHGRTGSFLMVHGGCGSIGCYAMTDGQIDEIWRLINAAFANGQARFQVQIYPFRMSEERLAGLGDHPSAEFWRTLKAGNDAFEKALLPPRVHVCQGTYQFSDPEQNPLGDKVVEAGCPAAAPRG